MSETFTNESEAMTPAVTWGRPAKIDRADQKARAATLRQSAAAQMWQILKDADREKLALALMPNGYTRAEADALIAGAYGDMIDAQIHERLAR
jgi:hypothetical protein